MVCRQKFKVNEKNINKQEKNTKNPFLLTLKYILLVKTRLQSVNWRIQNKLKTLVQVDSKFVLLFYVSLEVECLLTDHVLYC